MSTIKKQDNKNFTWRFIWYLLSGITAFIIEICIFSLLNNVFGMNLNLANSLSFVAGLTTSYILNNYLVFNGRDFSLSAIKRKLIYITLACTNLMITNILIWCLVNMGVDDIIAKLIVMAMVVVWNFIIFNILIFQQKSAK